MGPQNVIVVVLDSSNRRALFDAFEHLLRLRSGTLASAGGGLTNRSLTLPEAELLRAFNRRIRHRMSGADYDRYVKAGAVRSLVETRVPLADEPRVTTPAWAVRRAREFSEADVRDIGDLGVTIVGDLHSLAPDGPVVDEPFLEVVQAVDTGLAADFSANLLAACLQVASSAEGARLSRVVLDRARRLRATLRRSLPPSRSRRSS